jgi:2-hydroxy-3-oxopropionate reductase
MSKTIGFIGLGIMGKPMSKNLLKAGYSLVVYDTVRTVVDELVDAGAKAVNSPKEVAQQCRIIVTMLPNSPHVKDVVLGRNGIIDGAKPGTLLIDMSSIAPLASQEIAGGLAAKGIRMLDAPVSGGEPKAIEGTLSIMVGGKAEDFAEAEPILRAMGSSAVLVGDVGAGYCGPEYRCHVRGHGAGHQSRGGPGAGL